MSSHTILLVQFTPTSKAKSWSEHATVTDCAVSIIEAFQAELLRRHPGRGEISYEIEDLYAFVDGMHEMVCLVLDNGTKSYVPHDRAWIKEKLLGHLTRLKRQQEQANQPRLSRRA